MDPRFFIVITTIASPEHPALKEISRGARENDLPLIIVGDEKSPPGFKLPGASYYSMIDQAQMPFSLVTKLPGNTYSRKNLGYLAAMDSGAEVIVETDDDNTPLESFWSERFSTHSAEQVANSGWVNVYRYFTDQLIWPRGFPLQEISRARPNLKTKQNVYCPIQQGLVNGDPDIDAVHRMIFDSQVEFITDRKITVGARTYCPFNSQNTTWLKEVFVLMYLPTYCSFRMTDIWRSLIAQRILWTTDWSLLFHGATMHQNRNPHDSLKDFRDEVPGYLYNHEIVQRLEALPLKGGSGHFDGNLYRCYQEMVNMKLIEEEELDLVKLWLKDIERIGII